MRFVQSTGYVQTKLLYAPERTHIIIELSAFRPFQFGPEHASL